MLEASKPLMISRGITKADISKRYAVFAVLVLLTTSCIWAVTGAQVHGSNSDQLVNTYLFESWNTFHNAHFPAAHSFIIKWPLFLLIKWIGPTSFNFVLLTVLIVLVTVSSLAFILYRIDRRSIVFSTSCLAMASTLLLVPPQPYPGGILPVNMAMIATRNLEYILYIASLFLLVRSVKFRSASFWLAVALLGILGVSDRLFLTLSIGGAAMATVLYVFAKKRALVKLVFRWLLFGLFAAVAAVGVIWAINKTGLTHISGLFDGGPYGAVHSLKQILLGCVFAVTGMLTNFGANPAFDAQLAAKMPALAGDRLLSAAGITYILNLAILGAGLYATARLALDSFRREKNDHIDSPEIVSLFLTWSTLAAFAVFIFSNHYYVVDARYLAIAYFAIFIGAATYLRSKKFESNIAMLRIGALLTIGILFGLFSLFQTRNADILALSDIEERNTLIAQTLTAHHVDTLVGDYWRVIPVKHAYGRPLAVTPLDSCFTVRNMLSSSAWQPDLNNHSFAYVLSLDQSLTNYPKCSLDQVLAQYGRPNQSVLIAGSLSKPKELVLIYDRGIHKRINKPISPQEETSTVLPVPLSGLVHTDCPGSTTVLNIVAHQDDDLLFMNPDLQANIDSGRCVRTIFVTAGDAGHDRQYWQGRESGSEAAYSSLLGKDSIWIHRIIRLTEREYITVANPRGNTKISLIFMRLPDGNVKGNGFGSTHKESLALLQTNRIESVHSVDGQSEYNSNELTAALVAIMNTYKPNEIHSMATDGTRKIADHSDHWAVGSYAKKAAQLYLTNNRQVAFKYYMGYPVRAEKENVEGEAYIKKSSTFLKYAAHDGAVCQSLLECNKLPTYGAYLKRQYVFANN